MTNLSVFGCGILLRKNQINKKSGMDNTLLEDGLLFISMLNTRLIEKAIVIHWRLKQVLMIIFRFLNA